MKRIFLLILILSSTSLSAQVGIGTTNPSNSSSLDIVSTDKGVLIPRIALTNTGDTSSITSGNIESLLVYNTATSGDITPGYYYWDTFKWQRLTVSDDVDTKEPWFGTDDNAAATGNTEDMYLMSSKVGIGTITPEARLNVIQSGSIAYGSLENAALLVGTTTNGIGLDNNQIANYGSSLFFESEDGFTLSADVNSDGQINVNTSDKIMNIAKTGNISMDYDLYVKENVGVGTTSPAVKTHVSLATSGGTGVFSTNTDNMGLRLEQTTDDNSIIQHFLSNNSTTGVKQTILGINPTYASNDGIFLISRTGANDFMMNLANGTIGINAIPTSGSQLTVGGKTTTTNLDVTSKAGVGITPTARFEVQDATRTGTHTPTSTFYVTGNYGQRSNGAEFMHTNGTSGVGIGWEGIYKTGTNGNNNLSLSSQGTGNIYSYTNNAVRMTVAGDGEVGIGTTNPQGRLHVQSTDGDNLFRVRGPATSGELIFKDMTSADYTTGSNGLASLTTKSDGVQLLLPQSANLVFKIRNNDGSDGFHVVNNSNAHVFTANANGRVGINGNESPSYTLHVNGSVAGTSAYVNTSDARLKTNVLPLEDALDKVTRLKGVTFDWDTNRAVGKELELDNRNHIGFIAQQVEEVLPQVVSTETTNSEQIKSVAYADVVPVLVEAIKELNEKVETLESENKMLKSSLSAMNDLQAQIVQIKKQLDSKNNEDSSNAVTVEAEKK